MLGLHFGLDALSLFFLAVLAAQAVAAGLRRERGPLAWLAMLGATCAFAGQDAFTLSLGYGTALVAVRHGGALWPVPLAVAALLLAAFLPASGLAAPLVVLAAAPALGLLPSARTEPALLLAGHYLLLRYVLSVLAGSGGSWLPSLLLLLGIAVALGNALVALAEPALRRGLGAARAAETGLLVVALGLAALAKAWSQPGLAGSATAAILLGVVAQAFLRPLLTMGAETIIGATGATSLDWLGGLLRGMPRLGTLMVLAGAGWALLPLGPGFPSLILLLDAGAGALALAGGGARFGLCIVLAAVVAVWGLGFAAACRFIGIGFLGRPRSLRAAAAEDAAAPTLQAGIVMVVVLAVVALLPGFVLYLLRPVLALLAPAAPAVALGYEPLRLLPVLLLPAGAAFLIRRRFATHQAVEAPVWDGGLGKPPPWLPFGDPALQRSASGFAPGISRLVALLRPPRPAMPMLPWTRAGQALTALAKPVSAFALLAALLLGLLVLR